MTSDRKVRIVDAQTPPFRAVVIIKAAGVDQIWAQAKAESMLAEQIKAQVGLTVGMHILKNSGVYTVKYNRETGHYIHEVEAPDGVTFLSVEEVPNWWEAEDTIPMDRVPNGPSLQIALLPTLSLDAWRSNSWPDRPHP